MQALPSTGRVCESRRYLTRRFSSPSVLVTDVSTRLDKRHTMLTSVEPILKMHALVKRAYTDVAALFTPAWSTGGAVGIEACHQV
jgi:hypothetical protein